MVNISQYFCLIRLGLIQYVGVLSCLLGLCIIFARYFLLIASVLHVIHAQVGLTLSSTIWTQEFRLFVAHTPISNHNHASDSVDA